MVAFGADLIRRNQTQDGVDLLWRCRHQCAVRVPVIFLFTMDSMTCAIATTVRFKTMQIIYRARGVRRARVQSAESAVHSGSIHVWSPFTLSTHSPEPRISINGQLSSDMLESAEEGRGQTVLLDPRACDQETAK